MRWLSMCRELMSTGITVERRPLGTGGRVNRRDRRGSFSSPRRWWREEESEVEALRRKVPVSACVHGGGPPGLFYTCSEAAFANNAENLFFLLAQRPTLSCVWYFNRKFTCSSDERSVMSAAVDSPAQSRTVLHSPAQSWTVLDCRPVRPVHRGSASSLMVEPKIENIPGIMINWEDSLRSGQAFMSFIYFPADSEGRLPCWLHASIFLNSNLSVFHYDDCGDIFNTLSLFGGTKRLCSWECFHNFFFLV